MSKLSKRETKPAEDTGPSNEEKLPEELLEEQIIELPSREALSIVDPGVFGVHVPVTVPRPAAPVPPTDAVEPLPDAT